MWYARWSRIAVLGGSLIVAPAGAMAPDHNDRPVLYGVQATQRALVVRVISNGCTTAADFAVEVTGADGQLELAIRRIREDHCRMAPHIIPLEIAWPDGDAPAGGSFVLLNRLSVPDARMRQR